MTYENAFEKLVTAACCQDLCWRLYCTTCGNTEIRNGLELIGMNELPEAVDDKCLKVERLFDNRQGQCFGRDTKLACEAVRADLQSFSKLPRLTWLGCLGLTLFRFETPPLLFTEGDEHAYELDQRRAYWKLISASWANQFLDMLNESADKGLLEKLKRCARGEGCLLWKDLTPINMALVALKEQATVQ